MNIAEFEKYLRMNPSELKQLNTRLRTARILVNLRKVAIVIFFTVYLMIGVTALQQHRSTSNYTSDTMVPILSSDDTINSRVITQSSKDSPMLNELFQLLRVEGNNLNNLKSTKLCLNCDQRLAIISQNPISQTGQITPIFTYKKTLYKKPVELDFNLWDVNIDVVKLNDTLYIEKSSGIIITSDVAQQPIKITQAVNNIDKQLLLYLDSLDNSLISMNYELTDKNNNIISQQKNVNITKDEPIKKIDLADIKMNSFCVRTIVQTVEQITTTNKLCYQIEGNNFKKIVKKNKIDIIAPSELTRNDSIMIKNRSSEDVTLNIHDALEYLSFDMTTNNIGYDEQLGLLTVPPSNSRLEPITLSSKTKQNNNSRSSLLTTDGDCVASIFNTDDSLQEDTKVACSFLQKTFELSLYSSSKTTIIIIIGMSFAGVLQVIGLSEEIYRRNRLELLRYEYKGKQL